MYYEGVHHENENTILTGYRRMKQEICFDNLRQKNDLPLHNLDVVFLKDVVKVPISA